jgi:hypothetical protein
MDGWTGKLISLYYHDGDERGAHVSRKDGVLLGVTAEFITLKTEVRLIAIPRDRVIRVELKEGE